MTTAATVTHPARFTPTILDAIAPVITGWALPVHDPFAGTGERLGATCDRLGLPFTGTEIEPEFIVDPRVTSGDSADDFATYPDYPHVIVTSPAYPNGMADHFHAKDGTRRHTYRQALAETRGEDRPLDPQNMGRWGVRGGTRAEAEHWRIAYQAVCWWPDHVVVNVKDAVVAGDVYPVVDRWCDLLEHHGYELVERIDVPVFGLRHGTNHLARVDHETVIVATRSGGLVR